MSYNLQESCFLRATVANAVANAVANLSNDISLLSLIQLAALMN